MIALRDAQAGDYDAFTRLVGELGSGDPLPARERFEANVLARMTVAEASGGVIGFATWRAYGELAHVVQVAVDPAWRGRRVGEQLLERVRGLARIAGCTRWYLNVKRDNTPALRLYARCGFAPVRESWVLRVTWAVADAMARTDGTSAFVTAPTDDDAIAARFAVPVARLASLRSRAMLIGLREGGSIAGVAAFDASYPGAALFATIRPDLAGALLAACRPHAHLDRFDHLRVTVEGDAALADALRAGGAELAYAMLMLDAAL